MPTIYRISLLLLVVCVSSVASSNMEEEFVSNEASRDDSDLLLIILMCIVFCFAVRHANDFYAGETITLVQEGPWVGRFRHRGDDGKYLTHIERDFEHMYDELRDKWEEKIRRQQENMSSVEGSLDFRATIESASEFDEEIEDAETIC